MRFTRTLIPLVALAVIGLIIVRPASAAGSSASGLFAHFTVGGINTAIFPVNRLSSVGLGSAYNKGSNSGPYHKQLVLSSGGLMQLVLTVNATNMLSHIHGGFGVDTISEVGAAEVSGLTLGLLQDWGIAEPPVISYLQVSASRLLERGSYNRVAPTFATVTGFAGINDLVISGTLVGGKTLRFTGQPPENHVLYQSPTVTITLNRTTPIDLISCTPKCVATPVNISTSGIVISLNDAQIGPGKVTGQIVIGAAEAGTEGTF